MESLIECGPRGLVLVFWSTAFRVSITRYYVFFNLWLPREELIVAFSTHIDPGLEVILVLLPSPKCREHLVLLEEELSPGHSSRREPPTKSIFSEYLCKAERLNSVAHHNHNHSLYIYLFCLSQLIWYFLPSGAWPRLSSILWCVMLWILIQILA